MAARTLLRGAGLAAVASLALAGSAWAGQKKNDRPAPQPQARVQDATPGFTAAVDPQGHLRPMSAAEARELLAQLAPRFKSVSEPVIVALPGGGVAAAVDDSLTNFYLARVNADGSVGQACVNSEEAAATFLLGSGVAVEDR